MAISSYYVKGVLSMENKLYWTPIKTENEQVGYGFNIKEAVIGHFADTKKKLEKELEETPWLRFIRRNQLSKQINEAEKMLKYLENHENAVAYVKEKLSKMTIKSNIL